MKAPDKLSDVQPAQQPRVRKIEEVIVAVSLWRECAMLEETECDQSNSQKHENRDIDEHIVILHEESLGVFQEDSLKPHSFWVKDPHAGDDKS